MIPEKMAIKSFALVTPTTHNDYPEDWCTSNLGSFFMHRMVSHARLAGPSLSWQSHANSTSSVKGSSAHANPDHMYTQRPFSSLTIICARSWQSHVHTSEPHDHMYTQVSSSAHADDDHMYTHVLCNRDHMYTTTLKFYLIVRRDTTPLEFICCCTCCKKSHCPFRVYMLLHLM